MTHHRFLAAVGLLVGLAGPVLAGRLTIDVPEDLLQLDKAVDWTEARMIAVQDDRRYKTLDSFARESLHAMSGKESLPGVSPSGSLLEWIFNSQAYADSPVVYIKETGLRIHLTAHMPEAARQRIRSTGYMTPRELADPVVRQRVRELEPRFEMGKAINRYRHAEAVAGFAEKLLRLVPRPGDATAKEMWYSPQELLAAAPADLWQEAGAAREQVLQRLQLPLSLPDISEDQAASILGPWHELRTAWLARDAGKVQEALGRLSERLPKLAAAGVYPSLERRAAEARYYGMGKFTWGYWLYMLATLLGVMALVTGWRVPWALALVVLTAAMGLHLYGLGLRWYILGRIPVANMFEAVTASAVAAVAVGLVLELFLRKSVFVLASGATGFLALVLGNTVLPGAITPMMGILDDLMLRIHTVCIIVSYALVFLASIISVIYLLSYYVRRHPGQSLETSLVAILAGVALVVLSFTAFHQSGSASPGGVVKAAGAGYWFGAVSALLAVVMGLMMFFRVGGTLMASLTILLLTGVTLYVGNQGFVWSVGISMAVAGLLMGLVSLVRLLSQRGAANLPWSPELYSEGGRDWLAMLDQCQRMILNLVFVILFVGVILGAVWADYSWGRPWGWDPKEVFAMNTWIIYIILIHVRFVVKERGLWTAWMSVLGCLMMVFNWYYVNFHIVGLHSYA